MGQPMETLELEIRAQSDKAAAALESLAQSMEKLKTAVKGGFGLSGAAKQIESLSRAAAGIDGSSMVKIASLTASLKKLSEMGTMKLSSSVAHQLTKLGAATASLADVDFTPVSKLADALRPLSSIGKINLRSTLNQLNRLPALAAGLSGSRMDQFASQIRKLTSALEPLSTMGKSRLGTVINQLKKLPEVSNALSSMDMSAFARQMNQLANALRPLSGIMGRTTQGFSGLPGKLREMVSLTGKVTAANRKASKSYGEFGGILGKFPLKAAAAVYALGRLAKGIAACITESNQYIENLNLFTASMGQYAGEARKFAEQVGEIMGIDPGEWMRNQGVFMTLATGFGVAGDKAALMSKNLTQLGYDLSSFFNIPVEDSMQKLQAGISGELEPLRRLGYDLSQAKLQAIATELGITKSVTAMTQAEKAMLRYKAILSQVTVAQGDMARTLNAPANQMRILKAQVTQLARSIGNIFIPALQAVLPLAIAITKALRVLADSIASFFGYKVPEVDYSGLDTIVSGSEDAEEGMDGAAASAKKLKNAMIGLDELNVISPPDNSSGGAGGGGGGGFDFELPEYEFIGNGMEDEINRMRDQILAFVGELGEVLKPLRDRFADFFSVIGEQFKSLDWGKAWHDFFLSLADAVRAVGEALLIVFGPLLEELNIPQILYSGLEILTGMLDSLARTLDELRPQLEEIGEYLRKLGATIKEQFAKHDWVKAFASLVEEATRTVVTLFQSMILIVGPILEQLDIPSALYEGVRILTTMFHSFHTTLEKLRPRIEEIGKKLGDLAGTIREQFGKHDWAKAFGELVEELVQKVIAQFETMIAIVGPILENLDIPAALFEALNILTTVYREHRKALEELKPTIDEIGKNLGDLAGTISKQFGEFDWAEAMGKLEHSLTENIVKAVDSAIVLVKPTIEGLNIPALLFSGLETLTTLSENLSKVLDAVKPGLEGMGAGFGKIAEFLSEQFLKALEFVQGVIEDIGDWFTENKDAFTDFGQKFETFGSAVKRVLETFVGPLWKDLEKAFGGIIELAGSLLKSVLALIGGGMEGFSGLAGLAEAFGFLKPIINGITAPVRDLIYWLGVIAETLGHVISAITKFISRDWKGAWEEVKQVGSSAIEGVTGFFSRKWTESTEAATGVVKGFGTFFKDGFSNPLQTSATKLWSNIDKRSAEAASGVRQEWSSTPGWFSGTVVDPLEQKFKGGLGSIRTSFQDAKTASQNAWDTFPTWFQHDVTNIVAQSTRDDLKQVSESFGKTEEESRGKWNGSAQWFETNVMQAMNKFADNGMTDLETIFSHGNELAKKSWEDCPEWYQRDVALRLSEMTRQTMGEVGDSFSTTKEDVQKAWENSQEWFGQNVTKPMKQDFETSLKEVKNSFSETKSGVEENWGNTKDWFGEKVIEPTKTAFDEGLDAVGGFFETCWEGVETAWTGAKDWFENGVIAPLKKNFNAGLQEVGKFFSDAWQGVEDAWTGAGEWFQNSVLTPVKENFNTVLDDVGGFFEDLWKGVQDTFQSVSSWFESNVTSPIQNLFTDAMNGVADGINWVIDKLNGVSFDLPDWMPGIGGKSFGINIPRIPAFAEGGFPQTGQMFIAREAGPEMVGAIRGKTAVANNDQIVEGIAGGVSAANAEQNALLREQNALLRALLDKNAGVYLDGRKITENVEKHQRERGRVILTGGVV